MISGVFFFKPDKPKHLTLEPPHAFAFLLVPNDHFP